MRLVSTSMGDHFVIAGSVSNLSNPNLEAMEASTNHQT